MKIAIVEDDFYLRQELLATFERDGFETYALADFSQALPDLLAAAADLIVLDLQLPGLSGFDLCRSLKQHAAEIPVLILTARDTLEAELEGLALGADDFLTKPCPPERLLARARRLLQAYAALGRRLQVGELVLDTESWRLSYLGRSLFLPETEGRILALLLERSPELLAHDELLRSVWGEPAFLDENILQVNMTRLRKHLRKLGLSDCIETVRGEGYRLEAQA